MLFGWSDDGSRLLYSTFYPGPGIGTCEGRGRLFVLQAGRAEPVGELVPMR